MNYSNIVRSITQRPESEQEAALNGFNSAQLLDFLQGIKDKDFEKVRDRLEPLARTILEKKIYAQGRAEFKRTHWWSRAEVWIAIAALIVSILAYFRCG